MVDPYIVRHVDEALKGDKEVILPAVKQDGLVLKYAAKALHADKEVVSAAVENNSAALTMADEALKKDPEVVLLAVKPGRQGARGFNFAAAAENFLKRSW